MNMHYRKEGRKNVSYQLVYKQRIAPAKTNAELQETMQSSCEKKNIGKLQTSRGHKYLYGHQSPFMHNPTASLLHATIKVYKNNGMPTAISMLGISCWASTCKSKSNVAD